jgi:hypothetical protein
MSGFESAPAVLNFLSLIGTPNADAAKADLQAIMSLHAEWSALQKEVVTVSAARANLESQRAAEQAKVDASVAGVEARALEEERDLEDVRSRLELAEDEWAGCRLKSELNETVH